MVRYGVGGLAILGALLVAALPVALVFWLPWEDVYPATFVCWVVAGLLRIVGMRLLADLDRYAIAGDDRAPVLYLRSFRRDRRDGVRLLGTLLTNNMRLGGPTREEKLVEELRAVGPVVAIGRPGEWAPPLGAARRYVPDVMWKDTVRQLMRDAALVVVRPTGTGGLLWELTELVATVEPARIRLHFDGAGDYRRFRDWAWPLFPEGLPAEWPGDDIVFSDAWRPRTAADPTGEDLAVEPARRSYLAEAAAARNTPPLTTALDVSMVGLAIAAGIVLSRGGPDSPWHHVAVTTVVVLLFLVKDMVVGAFVVATAPEAVLIGRPDGIRPHAARAATHLASACTVLPAIHMKDLLARAGEIEAAPSTRWTPAHSTDAVEPVTDPLVWRVTLLLIGRAEWIAVRFANLATTGIGLLAVAAAAGLVPSVTVMIGALAFGVVAGVVIRSRTRGQISFRYLFATPATTVAPDATADRVRDERVLVTVAPHSDFDRQISRRSVRLGVPAVAVHVALLPIVLVVAHLTSTLWPGDQAGWTNEWFAISASVLVASTLYLAVAWMCVRVTGSRSGTE